MNKMGSMDIKKLVLSMSFPIIVSMLVQALYNIVDSMFVSRISEDALAAVTLSFPIQTIMVAVACGTGVGVNALISRNLGKRKPQCAQNVALHGIFLAIIDGLIFAVFGLVGTKYFLSFFVDQADIIDLGSQYLRICTICSIFVFVQITYERIMQATGHAFYNMIMQGTGAIINIILDYIFIFIFGLGVAGAALATITGQCVAMVLGILITRVKIVEIEIHPSLFSLSVSMIKDILKIGIPAILIQSIMSVMTVLMNAILIPFGTLVVSVFGIYFKLSQFVFMAVNGANNALIPIVSFNYGSHQYDRIKESVHFTLVLTVGIMVLGTIVAWAIPDVLLANFDASQDMLDIGVVAIRHIGLCFLPAGINVILCAALQALNQSKISLMITIARQLVILIPLSYLLMKTLGLEIGWFAFVITETICLGWAVIAYRKTIARLDV